MKLNRNIRFRGSAKRPEDIDNYIKQVTDYLIELIKFRGNMRDKQKGSFKKKECRICKEDKPHYMRRNGRFCSQCIDCTKHVLKKNR